MDDLSPSTIGLAGAATKRVIGDYATMLDNDEAHVRSNVEHRSCVLFLVNLYSSFLIFQRYLISIGSLLTAALTLGLMVFWNYSGHTPVVLDFILLTFAVVTPLTNTIMAVWNRRETALIDIANFRAIAMQLFLSQTIWDWGVPPKGKASSDINALEHADTVLRELILIADELYRFLTLPTSSTSW